MKRAQYETVPIIIFLLSFDQRSINNILISFKTKEKSFESKDNCIFSLIYAATTTSSIDLKDTLREEKHVQMKFYIMYEALRWRDTRVVIDQFITTNKANNYNCSLLEMVRNNISAL